MTPRKEGKGPYDKGVNEYSLSVSTAEASHFYGHKKGYPVEIYLMYFIGVLHSIKAKKDIV